MIHSILNIASFFIFLSSLKGPPRETAAALTYIPKRRKVFEAGLIDKEKATGYNIRNHRTSNEEAFLCVSSLAIPATVRQRRF